MGIVVGFSESTQASMEKHSSLSTESRTDALILLTYEFIYLAKNQLRLQVSRALAFALVFSEKYFLFLQESVLLVIVLLQHNQSLSQVYLLYPHLNIFVFSHHLNTSSLTPSPSQLGRSSFPTSFSLSPRLKFPKAFTGGTGKDLPPSSPPDF